MCQIPTEKNKRFMMWTIPVTWLCSLIADQSSFYVQATLYVNHLLHSLDKLHKWHDVIKARWVGQWHLLMHIPSDKYTLVLVRSSFSASLSFVAEWYFIFPPQKHRACFCPAFYMCQQGMHLWCIQNQEHLRSDQMVTSFWFPSRKQPSRSAESSTQAVPPT